MSGKTWREHVDQMQIDHELARRERTAVSTVELVGNMDARAWAEGFALTLRNNPELDPHDEEWMRGWFANAIMAGYDTAYNRLQAENARIRELALSLVPDKWAHSTCPSDSCHYRHVLDEFGWTA